MEYEIRLGKYENNTFKTDIGKYAYEKLESTLKLNTSWISQHVEEIHDIFYGDIRKSIFQDKTEITIQKKKISTETIKDFPFDVRISISKEVPVVLKSSLQCTYERKKYRQSFITHSWQIDLTKIISNNVTTYECELEFNASYVELHSTDHLKYEGLRQLKHLLTCANI